jgi:signal transduction histidine kinase
MMGRRSSTILGWGSFAATLVLAVPALAMAAANGPPAIPIRSALELQAGLELVALAFSLFLVFGAVGAIIVSNRPDNRVGWLFVVMGPVGGGIVFAFTYGYHALASDPGSLPAGEQLAWASDVLAPIILGLLLLMFIVFPEGRFRGAEERRLTLAALIGVGLAMLGGLTELTLFDYSGRIAAPYAPDLPIAVSAGLLGIGFLTIFVVYVAAVVRLIRRLRRAVGPERDQLWLFVWAAAVAAILFTPSFVLPSLIEGWASPLIFLISGVALFLVPVSVGAAILRHRLFDIDLVVRRTVVIAILGAFITAVYVAIVVGAGALVGSSGNVILSAIAAAVVALAFQPVRRWARRLADRLVYGQRATPYEVLHRFSERVAGSYRAEDVLPRMATILGEGTGAERAQVWLRVGDDLRPTAAWPDGASRSNPRRMRDGELPAMPDVSLAVAVQDRGTLLGALSVTKTPTDPVSPTEGRLVADLALQAGLVLRNAQLFEELRASRARLVSAQDEERRKIERNLHDGAQQQLIALAVKAKLADSILGSDMDRSRELLDEIRAEATDALESLRDLARGVFPPLLEDQGLEAALRAQAAKSPVPVAVHADGLDRYGRDVEATVYFCCLEALQNVAKYAHASRVQIVLAVADAGLRFEISDDGHGFDAETIERGSGLQNMVDRVEAVGGQLAIRSAPGEGTRITGVIPLHAGG